MISNDHSVLDEEGFLDYLHDPFNGIMGHHQEQSKNALYQACHSNIYRFYAILLLINEKRKKDKEEPFKIPDPNKHPLLSQFAPRDHYGNPDGSGLDLHGREGFRGINFWKVRSLFCGTAYSQPFRSQVSIGGRPSSRSRSPTSSGRWLTSR